MTPEDRIKELGSAEASTPREADWLEFRETAHRSLARRRVAAAVGGLGLVVAVVIGAYAVSNVDTGDRRGPAVAGTPTASGHVAVQQWFFDHEKLQVFYEEVPESETPEVAAINALLDGVPSILAETGVSSEIPEGVELVDLTIQNGTANMTLGGTATEMDRELAFAQFAYTLTHFPTVEDVVIGIQTPTFTDMGPAMTRKTHEDLLPPIVVESPMGGAEVYRSFKLSGIANVFEANVSWRLTDPDGNVFKEGFVTATCGSGCWGTFEDRITLERVPGASILLQVFQASAEDGSPMNLVTVPLNVGVN